MANLTTAPPHTGPKGATSNGKKKKKRSALANASNPHHLRNYVPSRLPNAGGGGGAHEDQNSFGPLPLRFLAADLRPPKGSKRPPVPPTTNPGEEWICAYCEYELFYGDKPLYHKAIRKRKKILRRRQRARERAAAAANGSGGNSTFRQPDKKVEEDYDTGYEPSVDEFGTTPKNTKWRGEGRGSGVGPGGGGIAAEDASYG